MLYNRGTAASTVIRKAGVVDGRRCPRMVSRTQDEPWGGQRVAAASAFPGTHDQPTSSAMETLACGLQPPNPLVVVLQPQQAGARISGLTLTFHTSLSYWPFTMPDFRGKEVLQTWLSNVQPLQYMKDRRIRGKNVGWVLENNLKAKTDVRLLGKPNSLIKKYTCLRRNSSSFGGGHNVWRDGFLLQSWRFNGQGQSQLSEAKREMECLPSLVAQIYQNSQPRNCLPLASGLVRH